MQWWQLSRPLLIEARRHPLAFNRMHPVEMLGDWSRLVGLNRTDEMPLQGPRCVCRTGRHLGQRFLQVVFPEVPLTAGRQGKDGIGPEGLADRQQLHG